MGLFKNNNLNSTKSVTTKEELKKAAKDKYGTIRITGALVDEIVKEQNAKTNASALGSLATIAFGIGSLFCPILAVPTVIACSQVIDGMKYDDYAIRQSMSKNDDVYLVRREIINKNINDNYKGKHSLKAGNIDELNDMIKGKVDEIRIDKSYMNDILEELNSSAILDKKVSIEEVTKFKGYKFITSSNEYLFVRIR